MTTFDQAMDLLGADELQSAERIAAHLAEQDAAFLANLVALRESSGLTQADLAAAWGRHRTAVSQFEQPGNDPRLSTIRRYAASIGARYQHMVYLDDDVVRRASSVWESGDEETQSELLPPSPVFVRGA